MRRAIQRALELLQAGDIRGAARLLIDALGCSIVDLFSVQKD